MPTSSPQLPEVLRRNRSRILEEWERRVRRAVPSAAPLSQEELLDNFPKLLDALADALEQRRAEHSHAPLKELARQHAQLRHERGYILEDVAREYALLRGALMHVLPTECAQPPGAGMEPLHMGLDQAVAESVSTYTLASTREQEQERQRFRLALRRANIMAFEHDTQLRYTWLHNPRLDIPLEELLGRTDAEVFPPAEAERLMGLKRQVLETGEPLQAEVWASFGSQRGFYLLALEPLRTPEGHITGVMGAATDITSRQEEEEQLRRTLEFRDRVMGIVSHDLRNPLNAITLSAAMLLRQGGLEERTRQTLERIVSAAERANRLTRDLLDYTKARLGGGIPIEPRACDLEEVVRQVVEEVASAYPERELSLVRASEGQLHGEWDPDRLAQVVTNLTHNAVQHSPSGTPVRVTTRTDADTVSLEVHNEGRPIAPELRPTLFEPFTQGSGHRAHQGSLGLGLYISRELVRAHGGTLEADSSAEAGTTFRLVLPREAPSGRREPQQPPRAGQASPD